MTGSAPWVLPSRIPWSGTDTQREDRLSPVQSTSTSFRLLFVSVLRLIEACFSASAGGIRATIEGPNITQVRKPTGLAVLNSFLRLKDVRTLS